MQEERLPNIISDLNSGNLDGIYDNILKGPATDKARPVGTSSQVDQLLNMYEQVQVPFYFDYYDGWERMSSSFSIFLALVVSAIIVISLSPVFSDEYSQKTDAIILTTKYGKNKVIVAKLISSFIFTLVVYLFFATVNFILHAAIYGLDGGMLIYSFIAGIINLLIILPF